jgi:hypothetical protein
LKINVLNSNQHTVSIIDVFCKRLSSAAIICVLSRSVISFCLLELIDLIEMNILSVLYILGLCLMQLVTSILCL